MKCGYCKEDLRKVPGPALGVPMWVCGKCEHVWNDETINAYWQGFADGTKEQAVQADACQCARPDKQFMPSPKAYCGKCDKIIRTA